MITSNLTFGEYAALFDCLSGECIAENNTILNNATKPDVVCNIEVPSDLKLITFGQYSDLCDVFSRKEQSFDVLHDVVSAIFPELTDTEINSIPVADVWGLCNWAATEIGNINKLFGEIKMDYTPQEKKAGIEQLQFGTFGILDWYAKRMGIHNQDEVNKEKWVRIYQCMKNDMEDAKFQRRLQKIYEQEAKSKH